MEEQAVVVSVGPKRALVRVVSSDACAGCKACGSCSPTAAGNAREVEVMDDLGVQAGQRVVIELPPGEVLRASLAVYLLPVIVFLVAGGGTTRLAAALGFEQAQLAGVVAGLAAMAVTFLLLHRGWRARQGRFLVPRVIRIEAE